MNVLGTDVWHTQLADPSACSSPLRTGVLMTFQNPVPYPVAWALQQRVHAERLSGRRADTLMLLEHQPIYTAGRSTRPTHFNSRAAFLDNATIPMMTVNRGGSVTYHGPGQLVAYPILKLSQHASGAKAYVHMLEEVLIWTLRHWDIHGYRVAKMPGVWVHDRSGEAKIASIGARIDGDITLHGFALNVMNDLRPFSSILPCGLEGCRMTSLVEVRQVPIAVESVAEQVAKDFAALFRLKWTNLNSDAFTMSGIDAHSVAATWAP